MVSEYLAITGAANSAGANPVAKVRPLVAGMVAGAEAIADIDRLRHAGNHLMFEQVRAPSTVCTFLRAFTHEHVRQLNRVPRELLVALCTWVNPLPGADQVVFVNLDSTHHQVHGYQKESAALGRHKGQKMPAPADRVGVHPTGPAGGGRDPAAQRQGGRPCRGRCGGDGGEDGPLGDRVAPRRMSSMTSRSNLGGAGGDKGGMTDPSDSDRWETVGGSGRSSGSSPRSPLVVLGARRA